MTRAPSNTFSFRIHGKTHSFSAPTKAECESWVVSVETAIKDAFGMKGTIASSDNYKNTHKKFGTYPEHR